MLRIKRTEGESAERRAATSATGSGRFQLGQGWLGRLRQSKRVRPLQISEVVQAVEEHLRAAALVSLESHFLPARLIVRLSEADWSSLSPFEGHLRQVLGETYARLAAQPKLAMTLRAPRIAFEPASQLALGDPPVLESSFDERMTEASWWPGKDEAEAEVVGVDQGEAAVGLFEVTTIASPPYGTARQTVTLLCLAPELPLSWLGVESEPDEVLRLGAEGEIEGVEIEGDEIEGDGWPGPPESLEIETHPPALQGSSAARFDLPVKRFHRTDGPDILWAPGGAVIVGRQSGRSHWVPDAAPRNLSARHLALILDDEGIAIADLASTNGVYVDGTRLTPLRPIRWQAPVTVDVGTESTMRLEIRGRVKPENP